MKWFYQAANTALSVTLARRSATRATCFFDCCQLLLQLIRSRKRHSHCVCAIIGIFMTSIATPAAATDRAYFMIESSDPRLESITGKIIAFPAGASMKASVSGAESEIRLADIETLVFEGQEKSLGVAPARVTLKGRGETRITVHSFPSAATVFIADLPMHCFFHGFVFPNVAATLSTVEAPEIQENLLPVNSGLFVRVAAEGQQDRPLLMIGQTDGSGNFKSSSYDFSTFREGRFSSSSSSAGCFPYLKIHLSQGSEVEIAVPTSFMKRLVFDGRGAWTITTINGHAIDAFTFRGLDRRDKAPEVTGVLDGVCFAKVPSGEWRTAEFKWAAPVSTPSRAVEAYFDASHSEQSIDVKDLRITSGEFAFSYRGLLLSADAVRSAGARITIDPHDRSATLLLDGQAYEGSLDLSAASGIGVTTFNGMHMPVAFRLDQITELRATARAEHSNREVAGASVRQGCADVERTENIAWMLKDTAGRSWKLTELKGYSLGEAYQRPPAGYQWTGRAPRLTTPLGGSNFAVDWHGMTLSLPPSFVAEVDVRGRRLRTRDAEPDHVELHFLGFSDVPTDSLAGPNVNNVLLRRDADKHVVAGKQADGSLLAFPVGNIVSLWRVTDNAEDGHLPGGGRHGEPGKRALAAIVITTDEGEITITDPSIEYRVGRALGDARAMARWILLGAPTELWRSATLEIPRPMHELMIEVDDGPMLFVSLADLEAVIAEGDRLCVTYVGGTVVGRLAPGQLKGVGPIGAASVDLQRIQGIRR